MSVSDGGPAFPSKGLREIQNCLTGAKQFQEYTEPGISHRDWLAGMAMQALIQSPDPCFVTGPDKKYVVEAAYEFADAMLAAKSPKTNQTEGK